MKPKQEVCYGSGWGGRATQCYLQLSPAASPALLGVPSAAVRATFLPSVHRSAQFALLSTRDIPWLYSPPACALTGWDAQFPTLGFVPPTEPV